jgi:hypothetical protein
MGELPVIFAYVGPETILPVTSVLAAIAGLFLAMGRSARGVFALAFRPFRKTDPAETIGQCGDGE